VTPLSIESLGMVTSVGFNVAQTMGSLLTGMSKPKTVPIVGADGKPLRVRAAPLSTGLGDGFARVTSMALAALAECAGEIVEPLPLVLCCPAVDALPLDHGALVRTLAKTGAIDATRTRVIAGGGHAAIGPAFMEAAKILALQEHRACLVGAVDTMLDVGRLARLMTAERLASDRTPDGFIPGEGAAFLRVSLAHGGGVQIAGVGTASEKDTRESGKVTGRAQADAARSALAMAGARMDAVSLLAADLTGERHRFAEIALAKLRLRPSQGQTLERFSLGTSLGETGCALGALSIAYLAVALERGWIAPGATAGLYLGADDGSPRCAVLLKRYAGGEALVRPPIVGDGGLERKRREFLRWLVESHLAHVNDLGAKLRYLRANPQKARPNEARAVLVRCAPHAVAIAMLGDGALPIIGQRTVERIKHPEDAFAFGFAVAALGKDVAARWRGLPDEARAHAAHGAEVAGYVV
jgi:hypothetical protein